jgi:hypothetical protein
MTHPSWAKWRGGHGAGADATAETINREGGGDEHQPRRS